MERQGLKTLTDSLVLTGAGHPCLPHSEVVCFSLVDEKGNLLEKEAPRPGRWPVPKSQLRPWLQLVDAMMREMPRSYGGHRYSPEPVAIEMLRHERRVDELLAGIFNRRAVGLAA